MKLWNYAETRNSAELFGTFFCDHLELGRRPLTKNNPNFVAEVVENGSSKLNLQEPPGLESFSASKALNVLHVWRL